MGAVSVIYFNARVGDGVLKDADGAGAATPGPRPNNGPAGPEAHAPSDPVRRGLSVPEG
jgi:hypothetical protein